MKRNNLISYVMSAFAFCVFSLLVFGLTARSSAKGQEPKMNPPSNVVGWHSGTYVQLNWDTEPESSVTGYNVSRLKEASGDWEKLTLSPRVLSSYVDYSPPSSLPIFYKVTGVFASGDEDVIGSTIEVPARDSSGQPASSPGIASQAYDKNDIITNQEFLNASSMSLDEIQSFLASHGSVLANYSVNGRIAAQHIYDACQTHGINPQVVLVTLQKEKGLIQSGDANPENYAMGWRTISPENSGFADQIYYGTQQFRLYYDNLARASDANGSPWTVGQARAASDGTVSALNTATAALYIYTPFIGQGGGGKTGLGGNHLFWDLWHTTFEFGADTASSSTMPSGWYWPTGSSNSCGYLGWLGYNSSYGYHLAQDMCNAQGNPVYSIGDGDVILSRTNVGGYGRGGTAGGALVARYQAGDGTWFTALYGHLNSPHAVGHVSPGEVLGYCNDYAPPHLHFGVHPGYAPEPTNPWRGYTTNPSNTYGFTDPIPFLNVHPSTPYEGYHDGVDCDKIFGWAWNRSQPNGTVFVNIYYDGANLLAGNVPANQYRSDLPGGGYHAFNYPTPAFLKNGQAHSIRLQISANAQDLINTPRPFNSTCGGVNPIISVNPLSQNFGSVQIGSSADRNFTVQNVGSGTLSGSASVPSPFSIISGASYNLSAGQTQTIIVRFAPPAAQYYSQNVTFTGGGGATRQVTGTGVGGGAQAAQITSPTPGSTLSGSTVTFFWNTGSGVSQYWLYVGNSPGNYDIYNQNQGSNLYATVTGMPTDGRLIYVTLWSAINGTWFSNSYTYVAANGGGGAATNRLLNSSFESGPVNWVQYSSGGYQDITTVAPVPPRSGSWLAYLGGLDNLTEYVYQDVFIPGNATQANVQFYYRINTQETSLTTCYDRLAVEVRRASDNVLLGTLRTLCNYNQTGVWTSSGLLSVWNFRGQTIRLRFIVTTDSSLHTGFFLDDITLVADGN